MKKTHNPIIAFFIENDIVVTKLRGKCYRIVLDNAVIIADSYRSLYRAYLSYLLTQQQAISLD